MLKRSAEAKLTGFLSTVKKYTGNYPREEAVVLLISEMMRDKIREHFYQIFAVSELSELNELPLLVGELYKQIREDEKRDGKKEKRRVKPTGSRANKRDVAKAKKSKRSAD